MPPPHPLHRTCTSVPDWEKRPGGPLRLLPRPQAASDPDDSRSSSPCPPGTGPPDLFSPRPQDESFVVPGPFFSSDLCSTHPLGVLGTGYGPGVPEPLGS